MPRLVAYLASPAFPPEVHLGLQEMQGPSIVHCPFSTKRASPRRQYLFGLPACSYRLELLDGTDRGGCAGQGGSRERATPLPVEIPCGPARGKFGNSGEQPLDRRKDQVGKAVVFREDPVGR